MKKLLLVAAFAIAANAGGLWSMVKNAGSDGVLNTKQYTIEVAGTDIRGYVFNVPEMKSICLSVWGGKSDSHQLECKTYKEIGIEEK